MLNEKGPVTVEEQEERELLLYTAKHSRYIYVVQLFDDFALVRSASPEYYGEVHRVDRLTFEKEFEEYCGDHDVIRESLFGDPDNDQDIDLIG